MFERLITKGHQVHMLRQQYRMYPSTLLPGLDQALPGRRSYASFDSKHPAPSIFHAFRRYVYIL